LGTNSGASGDKMNDGVFPETTGSPVTADNIALPVFGVNGCASGEKEEAGWSLTLSTGSSAEPSCTSRQHN